MSISPAANEPENAQDAAALISVALHPVGLAPTLMGLAPTTLAVTPVVSLFSDYERDFAQTRRAYERAIG